MAAIFAALPAILSAAAAAAPTLSTVATVASIAGTAVTAAGTIAAGKQAEATAKGEALQLEAKGKEEQAASQRDAEEFRRRKNLALSTLQANSAASGFTATDPTALALSDEISRYGSLQEQMAAYGGASRRAGLEDQAAGRRIEGKAARQGSMYSAAGTILGGITSMADRYNPKRQLQSNQYIYGPDTSSSGYR
jgi:hypothetical protein